MLVLVLTCGCASYPHRTAQAFADFQGGHFDRALAQYGDEDVVKSAFLSGAEAGTVALTAGDWEVALGHLHYAADAAEDLEGRALAGRDRLAEGLASWALNDTMRSYQGEGFERVYVHAGLALAYLAQGRLDSVYVEARRSNMLLEAEEELYETSYRAGGLGHFISALAYELLGEYDQAYIDYKRMEAKGVGTALAGRSLVRIATMLGREDELPTWLDRYGPDTERPAGAASVVVVAGVGLAPYKIENSMAVATEDGLLTFAAPMYQFHYQPVMALRLVDQESGQGLVTDVLESVSDVAVENLEDRLAWMSVKSIARGVLKRELTKEAEDKHGALGRLVGDLFTAITERADLRCWQTLPDTWQACRLWVPPGTSSFTLEAIGGESRFLGTYALEPGETMVVIARSVGPMLHAHVIGGQPVDPTLN